MNETNSAKLTAETISIRQLKDLREEALGHGDYEQVSWCDVALAPHELHDTQTAEFHTDPQGDVVTRTKAREICADVINRARAQRAQED